MGIARAAERLATAQSGLTHRTLADSCFCLDRRAAHNHAESLQADVQDGPRVQLRRWEEEGAAQGTAAQSYTPLHATGLHTLPWPACASAGP